MSQQPRECDVCGAPILGDSCNYCGAKELLHKSFNNGRCQNCRASLDVLRDKDGWLCCRYCGWPIRKDGIQKIEEEQTKPEPDPERPSSPRPEHRSILEFLPQILFMGVFAFIAIPLINAIATNGLLPIKNITSTAPASGTVSSSSSTPLGLMPLLQFLPLLMFVVLALALVGRILKD